MTSSSSYSSYIKIKSGPIDDDVLCMQDKHVSKHIYTSCPHVSSERINTRGNYSFTLAIGFLLDNEDVLPKNKCVINYCLD